MTNGTTVAPREVNILFAGLFFFFFSRDDSEGYVAVLDVDNHPLCITFNEAPDSRIELSRSLIRQLPPNLYIKKSGATSPSPNSVSRWGGWTPPANRFVKPPAGHLPFGWIADFENTELHGNVLNKQSGTGRPILHFWTGEFYTREVGKMLAVYTDLTRIKLLGRIASIIGVKISLADGESLIFQAGTFQWTAPSDTSTILIEHTCPQYKAQRYHQLAEEAAAQADAESVYVPEPNDMKQFYDRLFQVSADDRFKFVVLPVDPVLTDSHPFVCYGGGGSQTQNLP